MDVVEHGEPAGGRLPVQCSHGMPFSGVTVSKDGIVGIGIVLQVLPAYAVPDEGPPLKTIERDTVQTLEDASSGKGFVKDGPVLQLHIRHSRQLAGPKDGQFFLAGVADPRSRLDARHFLPLCGRHGHRRQGHQQQYDTFHDVKIRKK